MTRNLKALGLALAAMLALGAVAASAASAQEQGVLTSDGPVTLDIEELGAKGSGANALTAFGSKTECFGSSYTGHKFDTTPHQFGESGDSTTTITPHYNQSECRATTGGTVRPVTVETNGCDYVFHIGGTTPAGNEDGTYGVTADVVCPSGNKIHVRVWPAGTNPGEHATTGTLCTTEVGSQTGLEGAHATDEGNGHLRVQGTFTGIEVTRHGACQFFQPTTTNNGEFHLDTTVRGTNELGEETAISLSH